MRRTIGGHGAGGDSRRCASHNRARGCVLPTQQEHDEGPDRGPAKSGLARDVVTIGAGAAIGLGAGFVLESALGGVGLAIGGTAIALSMPLAVAGAGIGLTISFVLGRRRGRD